MCLRGKCQCPIYFHVLFEKLPIIYLYKHVGWRHMSVITPEITCNSTVFHQLVQANNNKKIVKASHYWALLRGIHRPPVNSPPLVNSLHKGPVMRKTLPCPGVILVDRWPVTMSRSSSPYHVDYGKTASGYYYRIAGHKSKDIADWFGRLIN